MDFQQWLTVLAAMLATGYLIRRGWTALRGRGSGCGGCQGCSPDDASRQPLRRPLVPLHTDQRREP